MQTETPINTQATQAASLASKLHDEMYGDRDTEPAPDTAQATQNVSNESDTPIEPATADTQSEPQPANDTFEQRYMSLKGKFDAEVPRLTATVKYLETERLTLQTQINELRQAVTEYNAKTKATEEPESKNFLEGFDDDLGKGVQQTVDEALKPLQEKIAKADEEDSAKAEWNKKINLVAELVGGAEVFNKIDSNVEYTSWLDGPMSPLDDRSKRQVMMKSLEQGNLQSVANFYITWADSQQSEPSVPAVDPLAEQVQPTVNYAEGAPSTAKTYTRADIKAFFHDRTMGKYKGREAESRSIELDILAAQSEGRVIG